MTVSFTTLFNLDSAGEVQGSGFVDNNGNLIFAGKGGLTVTDYEPGATQVTGGTVSELALTATGYASTLTTLAQFSGPNGLYPSSIIADPNGDLYGVTWVGGSYYSTVQPNRGFGTVFEISGGAHGYGASPTTLASFTPYTGVFPNSLVMDANGNLFGATQFGASSSGGTVFEVVKTAGGYSSTPIALATFAASSAGTPIVNDLQMDAGGNLFFVESPNIGPSATIYELANKGGTYAAAPTAIATIQPAAGSSSVLVGMTMDSHGNLFGVATEIGAGHVQSEVIFEIAKTATGFAAPATLQTVLPASVGSVMTDSTGDLFYTTTPFAAYTTSVLYELAKTGSGYATTPTALYSLATSGTLFADSEGNLFGVGGNGGTNGKGTVFEIAGAGFTVSTASAVGGIHAGQAASSIVVGDGAANVAANLDGLESLAKAGTLASITLTDGGIPTLSVTSAQLTGDQAALSAISGSYQLEVAAPAAGGSITGQAGHADTIQISGTAASYTVTADGNGTGFTLSNGTVTDHLSGITAVKFSDYTDFVASQTPVTAGGISSAQIANLYSAVFARTPDAAGLAYYEAMAAADPAQPITVYAQKFLSSPEYTSNSAHTYSQDAAGDAKFIADTYQNLLHRGPGSGDVAWYQANVVAPYLNGVTAGTAAYGAAQLQAHAAVLADFSQSAEFAGDVSVTAAHPADAQHWLILI